MELCTTACVTRADSAWPFTGRGSFRTCARECTCVTCGTVLGSAGFMSCGRWWGSRYTSQPFCSHACTDGSSMKIGTAPRTFQELIFGLQRYWSEQGCVILQPYDMEVGAGTFHTATFLRSIGPEPWSAAYLQPSRRPTDGRYGDN